MRYHYKYSHEHLDFIKVRQNIWQIVNRYLLYFIGSILLAVGYYIVFSAFFYTPEERGLLRENKMLTEQYTLLNQRFDQLEDVLNDISQRDHQIYRTIFQADPLPYSVSGVGGVDRYLELESFSNKDMIKETDKRLRILFERANIQSASMDTLMALAQQKESEYRHLPAIQPIRNKDLSRTGSSVGPRIHPFYKILKIHTGIDFTAALGVDVMATGDGTVIAAERSLSGYGNKVVIDHGSGYTTLYAHLNDIKVSKGHQVKRGQVIATVGNTGMSMVPHLHYEVLKNGEFQDPLNFFFIDVKPEEYDRIIQLASNSGQSMD